MSRRLKDVLEENDELHHLVRAQQASIRQLENAIAAASHTIDEQKRTIRILQGEEDEFELRWVH